MEKIMKLITNNINHQLNYSKSTKILKKVPSKENENKLKKQYQNNTHTGSSSSRYQKRIVKNNFLLKNKKIKLLI